MTGLGASAALFGVSGAVGGLSEIAVFILAPRIVKRGQARFRDSVVTVDKRKFIVHSPC
jgi:hypothetical protein